MTIAVRITIIRLMVRTIIHELTVCSGRPGVSAQLCLLILPGDEVPVPHAGLALTVEQFHELAARLKDAGVTFIIEPHLRFEGQPGEQYTMFFKDPSGNNLEFKAMTKMENLFAKYNVVDK